MNRRKAGKRANKKAHAAMITERRVVQKRHPALIHGGHLPAARHDALQNGAMIAARRQRKQRRLLIIDGFLVTFRCTHAHASATDRATRLSLPAAAACAPARRSRKPASR